jgi:CheY-like chemotaxis protein
MPMHFPFRPRVLLIGPANESRASLGALLEGWSCRVQAADDGAAGLRCALSWRPEAAIVSTNTPPTDGYAAGHALRAALGPGLLLVARVGFGQSVDVERAFAVGFNAVFDGPADPAALRALLGPALGVGQARNADVVGSRPSRAILGEG